MRFAVGALLAVVGCAEKRGNIVRDDVGKTGVEWRHIGAGMGGNSYWLTVDPNDDRTLFYSPDVGGAYRTRDGGRTWKHLAVGFSHERRIGCWTLITVAPSDSKVVYASAGQRFLDYSESNPADAPYIAKHGRIESGMVRSTDGGDTWETLYRSPLRAGAVAVDPDDANTLWVAGPGYRTTCLFGFRKTYDPHGEGWVAKSTDGGKTWNYAFAGCTDSKDANVRKVCYSSLLVDRMSPKGRRTLYLSGNGGGVWKSTDGGTTWVTATNGLPTSAVGQLALSYGADGKLSLFAAGCYSPYPESAYPELRKSNKPGIYRSDDGGASWRDVSGDLDRRIGRYRITVDPKDKNVMYTAQGRGQILPSGANKRVLKTTDGGKTWKPCMDYLNQANLNAARWNNHYPYIGSPDTFIAISPTHPEKLWFADAGCVMWETRDAGGHWDIISSERLGGNRFRTRGMDNSFILSLSVSPKNRDFLLMTCHDFDFLSSVDGGKSFFSGGQTGGITASGAADGCFGFMSVAHDPADPKRAYAGSKGWSGSYSEGSVFLTTTDGGYTWHAPETNPKGMKLGSVADILSDEAMKDVEIRPSGVYRKGRIMLHNWAIRHLEIAPKTGRIFATKRTGVYYSDNKGGDWMRATFEGIGKDCDWAPNYVKADPVNGRVYAVASYLPLSDSGLFSGLHQNANGTVFDPRPDPHGGLYVSDDNGATFRKIGKPVPEMVLPTHFAVVPGSRTVYLGTIAARVRDTSRQGEHRISAGLWRSDDLGETWTRVLWGRENRLEGRIEGIAINPQRPDTVYAVMREPTVSPALAAILRTTDGGKSWTDISGEASHYTYTWLSLSAADPRDILIGTAGGGAYIGHDNDVK